MHELSLSEMKKNIMEGKPFSAKTPDGALELEIQDYLPYLAVALHGGHLIPDPFVEAYQINEADRRHEEDPHTEELARLVPINLVAKDSRYFYDLNRHPDQALYKAEAWDKNIWIKDVPENLKIEALRRHAQFHDLLKCLVEKLILTYDSVLVMDLHSYNPSRQSSDAPLFNLGSHFLSPAKHKIAEYLRRELGKIELPNLPTFAVFDSVFQGKGYLSQWINNSNEAVTSIPLEVKKVFCDEETGELFPLVFEELKKGMAEALSKTASHFAKKTTNLRLYRKGQLVSKQVDQELRKLDQEFYKMAKDFDLLSHVNPINLESARKKFLRSRDKQPPVFRYRQLRIDPFLLKRRLFELPIERIRDPHLQGLYRDSILSYAQKADMLIHLGSKAFYYHSLAYFGEPDKLDLANARFLLYCPDHPKEETEKHLTFDEARNQFQIAQDNLGFKFKIEENRNMVANAISINQKLLIQLKKGVVFHPTILQALIHHEAGVHLLTTINAREQPLKIMSLGLPQNTRTQEGLAILNEFLSGNLTVMRLKDLALRVLAVSMMTRGADFVEVYRHLHEEKAMEPTKAFTLSARIFRGGGFTKDYLYLNGLITILKLYQEKENVKNLFIGKTSLEYLPVIEQLIDRRILVPPKHLPAPFLDPAQPEQIVDYLIKGIKSG